MGTLCCCGCDLVGQVQPKVAKWFYFTGFIVSAIIAWVLRDYGQGGLRHLSQLSDCASLGTDEGTCLGKAAVLRISFGNAIFFAAHMLALLCVRKEGDSRLLTHTAFWPFKLALWALVLGLTFIMPNGVFDVWFQIARVFSGIFLVFQIILLLDFIYVINEYLLEKDNHLSKGALISGAVLLYAAALAIIGITYHLYAPDGGCHLNIFFITWTLILGLAVSILSLTPCRPKNAGLLTAGAVFAYAAFLLWSALTSEPASDACVFTAGSGNTAVKVISFVLAVALVCISTFTSGTMSKEFNLNTGDAELPYRPDFFHFVFFLASAYLSMLFTGWSLDGAPGNFQTEGQSWASTWVKIVSQWVCVLLYMWSLIAPTILKNRDFT